MVVIGASAGGVTALRSLAAGLPQDFPAALLIVLHVGSHQSILPQLLSASGPLPAAHALDGEVPRPGHIHVAPPDHHLIVEDGRMWLVRGPKEHHSRPAVDPLFRSAALDCGPGVAGVIMTGRLDDGTAGLQAIKGCGGLAVVQDPLDATEPSMPSSALRYVEVDHCVSLQALPGLLVSIASRLRPAPVRVDPVRHEVELSLARGAPMEHLEAIGKPSPFVCPDCKGGLWAIDGTRPQRFRCHTGHAFTLRSLQHVQSDATDEALWHAIRGLQEKTLLLQALQASLAEEGQTARAAELQGRIELAHEQTEALRELVEIEAADEIERGEAIGSGG